MSDPEKPDEPKLVVDTDWKEQVAREKEQAMQAAAQQDGDSAVDEGTPAADSPGTELPGESAAEAEVAVDDRPGAVSEDGDMPAPPPATFEVHISMMFTQAMAMLGQMPDPSMGKATVNKPFAKHYIDTLDMLGEKTRGNLSDSESKVLSEALHALRMMYVNAGK